jgi:hypothetical protein
MLNYRIASSPKLTFEGLEPYDGDLSRKGFENKFRYFSLCMYSWQHPFQQINQSIEGEKNAKE